MPTRWVVQVLVQVFHPRAAKAGAWMCTWLQVQSLELLSSRLSSMYQLCSYKLSCACHYAGALSIGSLWQLWILMWASFPPPATGMLTWWRVATLVSLQALLCLTWPHSWQLMMLERFCSLKFEVRKPWNSSIPPMRKVLSIGPMVSRWGSKSIWRQRGSRPIWESYKYLATFFAIAVSSELDGWHVSVSVIQTMKLFSQVAKVDSRCAGRWHCKESNATTSSHKQTYVVLAFTVPLPTDGSKDALVAALKGLGFPLDGGDGVLQPLPPALVAADARKRMAKSKYLKLFRKAAKTKKAGWLFSISKASSITALACQRCQTFYRCWVSQHLRVKDVRHSTHVEEFCSHCHCSSCEKIRSERNEKKVKKEKKEKKKA